MSRLFNFEGDDTEYIKFLESKLLNSGNFVVGDTNSNIDEPIPAQVNLSRVQDGNIPELQLVFYRPEVGDRSVGKQPVPKWRKQLNEFTSSVPSEENWARARQEAGIHTIQRNRWAIQLMLGRTIETALPSEGDLAPSDHPPIQPEIHENRELIQRGCKYGTFMSACANRGIFSLRVTEYQNMIFTSYCVVLLRAGNSKETVHSMMRQYINKQYDDKTLDNYHYGAVWANRCMALLLRQGWGHRSWEIFLLQGRSCAQFGRFAVNSSRSYEDVTKELGEKKIPIYETGWIPYCLPCIVKSIIGNAIGLPDICKYLGYGSEQQAVISSIYKIFFQSFDPFDCMTTATYAERHVPLDPIRTMSNNMAM